MRTGLTRASAVTVFSAALLFSVPLGIGSTAASQSRTSVAAFVALATRGLSGTYTELYRVTGPNGGTVQVFQQAPSGIFPFTTGHGRWSFRLQAQSGISSQWVEHGSTAWDCWRPVSINAWKCSGPGHFEDSNGFFLSVEPYIPGVVVGDLHQLELGLKEKAPQVKNLVISDMTNPRFGSLRCLEVDGITSCIDRAGVLVSQQGGSYWSSITLLRRSTSVPGGAFELVGKSTSSGLHFTPIPN